MYGIGFIWWNLFRERNLCNHALSEHINPDQVVTSVLLQNRGLTRRQTIIEKNDAWVSKNNLNESQDETEFDMSKIHRSNKTVPYIVLVGKLIYTIKARWFSFRSTQILFILVFFVSPQFVQNVVELIYNWFFFNMRHTLKHVLIHIIHTTKRCTQKM